MLKNPLYYRSMATKLLVTGGSGFIGSAFIRSRAEHEPIINVDIGTYAADIKRIEGTSTTTVPADVASPSLEDVFNEHAPHVVVHFAAETHVTRSETDPDRFYRSNVVGTRGVLEAAERCNVELVIHVSTDEVYGPASATPFKERDKLPGEGRATSAYSRSKAVADDLAAAASDRVPVIVVRPTNCFGPWQHPEKAIPRWIIRALTGQPIPVWGDGGYVRDWMYVDDACAAISTIIERGQPGEIYNIGPEGEVRTNLEIAEHIATSAGRGDGSVYLTEYDRPGHDRRYSVDSSKLSALGWSPQVSLDHRLEETVAWYRGHASWWEPLVEASEALYDDAQVRGPA